MDPARVSFTFAGPGAAYAMDMMRTMAEYLAGPGLPGFVAWCDQQIADGGGHAPPARPGIPTSPEVVRRNLLHCQRLIDAQLARLR